MAATGGNLFAVNDSDFTLVTDNPSLLNAGMHNHFILSYTNYISDINAGYAGYAADFKSIGTVAAGLKYINYGKFIETDIYDQKLGEFSASDYSLNLTFSKKLHPQILSGGTIKGIYSSFYAGNSYGVAADLAGTLISKNSSFIAAMVFKNMGAQITTYSQGIREPLPFEVQLGLSKKIKYAPIRLVYSLRNLQKWRLASAGMISFPAKAENNETYRKLYDAGYNFALHSGVGIEFFPVKSFIIRFGYEHKKRNEMKMADRSGLIGFSIGAGIRILKMNLSYARSSYHFAGASNHLTISMNPFEFSTRKTAPVLFEEINPDEKN